MEQFQKNNIDRGPQQQPQGFLHFLRSAFSGSSARENSPNTAEQHTPKLHLPSHGSDGVLLTPSFRVFRSQQGKPTLVCFQREPCDDRCGGTQTHFLARQNSGGVRHQLDYALITALNGDRILKGSLSEVGLLPSLPSGSAPERPHTLIRFHLEVHRDSKADALCLSRSAWDVLERFVESGLQGVDEQLARSQRFIALTEAHIFRSSRYKQEFTREDLVRGDQTAFYAEDDFSNYYTRSPRYNEVYESIRTVMNQLGGLSMDEFKRQKATFQPVPDAFSMHYGDVSDELPAVKIKERWFAAAVQAEFTTPEADKYSSVALRLSVPYTRADSEIRFNSICLEIVRPHGALGLRERLRVNRRNDILGVTQFSYNDELFRNLFRTVHRVNHSPLLHDAKIQSVLDVLAQYDLYPRAANPQAYVGALRRWAFARSIHTQHEQTGSE